MNALTNAEVGRYLNANFVSTYQKVGTFTINGAKKQGGNVASYFCTANGRVLHTIAGPVNADVLLREARWVVETSKMADLQGARTEARLRLVWRKAHAERLHNEHDVDLKQVTRTRRRPHLNKQGKVHYLLAMNCLPRLEQVYKYVFEDILHERVSTAPVERRGG
ncbi:MAG: hypothetical protein ACRELF_26720 [Gemmataceae bacterium]